eukprot:m.120346 g.120346  ORF g.120346 m.120346 type:complete len:1676 (-) comp11051_c0_seq1:231-5258(-)
MFLARIDPSPKAEDKPTVEAAAFVRNEKGQTVAWFGLSTGELQSVILERQEVKHRLLVHRQIVTCLCSVDNTHLWSGSFDRTLKVFNTKTRRVVQTLKGHTDAITCMLKDGQGHVLSGSLNGQLLRWRIRDCRLLNNTTHILTCPRTGAPLPIYSLTLASGKLWVGAGDAIVHVNLDTLAVMHVMTSSTLTGSGGPGADVSPASTTLAPHSIVSDGNNSSGSEYATSRDSGVGSERTSPPMPSAVDGGGGRGASSNVGQPPQPPPQQHPYAWGGRSVAPTALNMPRAFAPTATIPLTNPTHAAASVAATARARSASWRVAPSHHAHGGGVLWGGISTMVTGRVSPTMAALHHHHLPPPPPPPVWRGAGRISSHGRTSTTQGGGGDGVGGTRAAGFTPMAPSVLPPASAVTQPFFIRTDHPHSHAHASSHASCGDGGHGGGPLSTLPRRHTDGHRRVASGGPIPRAKSHGTMGGGAAASGTSTLLHCSHHPDGSDDGRQNQNQILGGSVGAAAEVVQVPMDIVLRPNPLTARKVDAASIESDALGMGCATTLHHTLPHHHFPNAIAMDDKGGPAWTMPPTPSSHTSPPRPYSATPHTPRTLTDDTQREGTRDVAYGGQSNPTPTNRVGVTDNDRHTQQAPAGVDVNMTPVPTPRRRRSLSTGHLASATAMWSGGGDAGSKGKPSNRLAIGVVDTTTGGTGRTWSVSSAGTRPSSKSPQWLGSSRGGGMSQSAHNGLGAVDGEPDANTDNDGHDDDPATIAPTLNATKSLTPVAANCVSAGPNGLVWSCSENAGIVQVWRDDALVQGWEIACAGLNHIQFARGHAWIAGADGALYIWDAELLLPVVEVKAHAAPVRAVAVAGDDTFVLSLSASMDGSVGMFQAAARGRISGAALPLKTDSITLYDRYGFVSARPPSLGMADPSLDTNLTPDGKSGTSTPFSLLLPVGVDPDVLEERRSDQAAHMQAWDEAIVDLLDSTHEGDTLRQALTQQGSIRFLIERGVPDKYRGLVWRILLQSWGHTTSSCASPTAHEARTAVALNEKMERQIEVDLQRTFPTNKHFRAGGTALKRLRRILQRFAIANPAVEYCQGFNFIAGFALLFLDEKAALVALKCIIESIMPVGYFTDPMLASRADQPVFRAVVATWLPDVDAVLTKFDSDLSLVSFNWFFTVFVDAIPTDLTVRIWDLLFLDGDIALFRVGYALLKLNADLIASAKDQVDLFMIMRSLAMNHDAHDTIISLATKKCPVTKEFIVNMRKIHTERIQEQDRIVQVEIDERKAQLDASRRRCAGDHRGEMQADSIKTTLSARVTNDDTHASSHDDIDVALGLSHLDRAPAIPDMSNASQLDAQANVAAPSPADGAVSRQHQDGTSTSALARDGRQGNVSPTFPVDIVDIGAAAIQRRCTEGGSYSSGHLDVAAAAGGGSSVSTSGEASSSHSSVQHKGTDSHNDATDSSLSSATLQVGHGDQAADATTIGKDASTIFNHLLLGGTGDGFVEPSQSLTHSVSRWTNRRLSLRATDLPVSMMRASGSHGNSDLPLSAARRGLVLGQVGDGRDRSPLTGSALTSMTSTTSRRRHQSAPTAVSCDEPNALTTPTTTNTPTSSPTHDAARSPLRLGGNHTTHQDEKSHSIHSKGNDDTEPFFSEDWEEVEMPKPTTRRMSSASSRKTTVADMYDSD